MFRDNFLSEMKYVLCKIPPKMNRNNVNNRVEKYSFKSYQKIRKQLVY